MEKETEEILKHITKVYAIKKVMEDNNGIADLQLLYNETIKYYPDIRKSKDWEAGLRGVLYREIKNNRNFKKIADGTYALINFTSNNLIKEQPTAEELKEIKKVQDNVTISETEKTQIIKARLGQGEFREKIIIKFSGKCAITGVDDTSILIASHIKPWKICSNEERLSRENGILLTPTYDKLFDKGIISFNDKGLIIQSSYWNVENFNKLGITKNIKCNLHMTDQMGYFLHYHRNYVFRKY